MRTSLRWIVISLLLIAAGSWGQTKVTRAQNGSRDLFHNTLSAMSDRAGENQSIDGSKTALGKNAAFSAIEQSQLIANFSAWVTRGYAPFKADFKDASLGIITTWHWDFGDGQASPKQNPSHVYAAPGRYTISLTVSDSLNSNSTTKIDYLTVLPTPLFDISADNILVLPDSTVTVPLRLINKNARGITAFGFKLLYPDSLLSFIETSATGTLTQGWIQSGGQETAVGIVTVGGFNTTAIASSGILLNVRFKVKTTAAGVDTLRIRDLVDDLSTATSLDAVVKIGAPLALRANFVAGPTRGLAPLKVDFTDLSDGEVTNWDWDLDDGSGSSEANPSHTYSHRGSYSVRLTVAGPGGHDTITKQNYIEAIVDSELVVTPRNISGSPGRNVLLPIELQNPNSFAIDSIGMHLHFPSTLLSFTRIVTDSTLTEGWIEVLGWTSMEGLLEISGMDSIAVKKSGTLFKVEFAVKPEATGSGPLQLTNFADKLLRASTTDGLFTTLLEAPIADFSADPLSGVAPLAVHFSDLSIGNITSWNWNFGDGSASTEKNPTHTYLSPDTFSVSLEVTGPSGSNSKTRPDLIQVSKISGLEVFLSDTSGSPCTTTRLPIILNNPENAEIDAFGMKLLFPPGLLNYLGVVTKGTLTENWTQVSGLQTGDSTITIGGYATTPTKDSGKLLLVEFKVLQEASGSDSFRLADFVDDFSAAYTTNGKFTVGNIPPSAPELLFPKNDTTLVQWPDSIRFVWHPSQEVDPCDSVLYTLLLSRDAAFPLDPAMTITKSSLPDTFCSLAFANTWQDGEYYWTVKAIDTGGNEVGAEISRKINVATAIDEKDVMSLPRAFQLLQNRPNPFKSLTTIEYHLPLASDVGITIFDISGRQVFSITEKAQAPGIHIIVWNGLDDHRRSVPSGMYLCQLMAGQAKAFRKMLLLR
jgi:PKD repeat protein